MVGRGDQFTETTSQSWFSRIGGAFAGVVFGLVMILVCVVALAWNENRAIRTQHALKEGAGQVVAVPTVPLDPAREAALVHVSGPVTVGGRITDDLFGVTAPAVRLMRRVEMYQWKEDSKSETRTKLGGGEETVTTYIYTREWSGQANKSSEFKEPVGHENPPFDIESQTWNAPDAHLGAFALNDDILNQLDDTAPLRLGDQEEAIRAAIGDGRPATVSATLIYLGAAPATPAIGDVRVSYAVVDPGEISVVGRQSGDDLIPYRTRNGETVLLVSEGSVPADEMFAGAQDGNRILTWIIRGAGVAFLCVGFGLILAPLGALADVLPFLGAVVRMGTGLVGTFLGLTLGLVMIALAWLAVRPLMSLAIVAGGGIVAVFLTGWMRKRARKAAPAAATTA
ncbi:hypothetical protein ASG17_03600 [Brevundimonas sp. Leaf363]|uniref:TMEM43 family protein n=1 Tax=Brevundimonas sp. Leaf363 TaxID=1736353 RepID=UPI0006FF9A7B|nr:TMEM43 family protein [Brevundimonas sp. Leaf363]KQS55189.1 hypothetical protein ASG17_03600 [Brevundimonas sp. Leaf363]